ncbi:MAG: hypothetical protein ACPKOP_05795 [Sphaerochaetaceae bacterium]
MKNLMKVLLLLLFAVVVFIPNNSIAAWAYWSLFVLMFVILFIYYRVTYYVSEANVLETVETPIDYSCFCAKVPPMSNEDLVRGRMVITGGQMHLYQKGIKKGEKISHVFQRDISQIARIETGKVVGLRHGLIFTLTDGRKDLFVITRYQKVYDEIVSTLGWSSN